MKHEDKLSLNYVLTEEQKVFYIELEVDVDTLMKDPELYISKKSRRGPPKLRANV